MSAEFRLFNTLTRRVEAVRPITPGQLNLYGCGPTVYSYAHIGNFRSFLTADLILRTARAIGWKTTYVTNITDVGHLTGDDTVDPSGEDRMARALHSKEGERFANVWDLARHYTGALLDDWATLNLIEPDARPRATEHIREQILAVESLIQRGLAYETSRGVYFSVDGYDDYGRLSGNQSAESLDQAVRDVVVDREKRSPRDFALWKKDSGHLMQWHSPWGWGFPGWHIECSVMAQAYLGEQIDMHTGGEDLIFPHHECERAQAESLSGKPFARHWVHTRFLQVEGQKMSKSLGNFFQVRDLVQERGVDPLAVRLTLISGQYRKPFNFTLATLRDSERHTRRFKKAQEVLADAPNGAGASDLTTRLDSLYDQALSAMLDDLNTPVAISKALEGVGAILADRSTPAGMAFLERIGALLGLTIPDGTPAAEAVDNGPQTQSEDAEIELLIRARTRARKDRDYAMADAIRDELLEMNIEIKDSPTGTTWRRRSRI